jgi:G3E family GTPase
MDLVADAAQTAAIAAQLRAINSSAQIIHTTRSEVDLAQLLNRGAYRLRLLEQQQQQAADMLPAPLKHPLDWLGDAAAAAGGSSSGCHAPGCTIPEHAHHPQQQQQPAALCGAHDQAVHTIALRVQQPLQLDRFRAWVEQLLWEPPPATAAAAADGVSGQQAAPGAAAGAVCGGPELLRMKGLLHVAGSDRVHLFQAVCDLYDIAASGGSWQEFGGEAGEQQPRMSRLVLIGRHLDQARLQAQLQACCCDSPG